MTIQLDVQLAIDDKKIPAASSFKDWAKKIPSSDIKSSACLRVVDEKEAKQLNHRYRNINKATNVLSFPADIPSEVDLKFLGDVVICAPVVYQEAVEQNKDVVSHWAHLLVHGILHLQGYVHDDDKQAAIMEALEIETLQKLGIENPYR
ncbi:MAG: rRNA maturation RNase YbeY [Gammaproteobacteria bacterium]